MPEPLLDRIIQKLDSVANKFNDVATDFLLGGRRLQQVLTESQYEHVKDLLRFLTLRYQREVGTYDKAQIIATASPQSLFANPLNAIAMRHALHRYTSLRPAEREVFDRMRFNVAARYIDTYLHQFYHQVHHSSPTISPPDYSAIYGRIKEYANPEYMARSFSRIASKSLVPKEVKPFTTQWFNRIFGKPKYDKEQQQKVQEAVQNTQETLAENLIKAQQELEKEFKKKIPRTFKRLANQSTNEIIEDIKRFVKYRVTNLGKDFVRVQKAHLKLLPNNKAQLEWVLLKEGKESTVISSAPFRYTKALQEFVQSQGGFENNDLYILGGTIRGKEVAQKVQKLYQDAQQILGNYQSMFINKVSSPPTAAGGGGKKGGGGGRKKTGDGEGYDYRDTDLNHLFENFPNEDELKQLAAVFDRYLQDIEKKGLSPLAAITKQLFTGEKGYFGLETPMEGALATSLYQYIKPLFKGTDLTSIKQIVTGKESTQRKQLLYEAFGNFLTALSTQFAQIWASTDTGEILQRLIEQSSFQPIRKAIETIIGRFTPLGGKIQASELEDFARELAVSKKWRTVTGYHLKHIVDVVAVSEMLSKEPVMTKVLSGNISMRDFGKVTKEVQEKYDAYRKSILEELTSIIDAYTTNIIQKLKTREEPISTDALVSGISGAITNAISEWLKGMKINLPETAQEIQNLQEIIPDITGALKTIIDEGIGNLEAVMKPEMVQRILQSAKDLANLGAVETKKLLEEAAKREEEERKAEEIRRKRIQEIYNLMGLKPGEGESLIQKAGRNVTSPEYITGLFLKNLENIVATDPYQFSLKRLRYAPTRAWLDYLIRSYSRAFSVTVHNMLQLRQSEDVMGLAKVEEGEIPDVIARTLEENLPFKHFARFIASSQYVNNPLRSLIEELGTLSPGKLFVTRASRAVTGAFGGIISRVGIEPERLVTEGIDQFINQLFPLETRMGGRLGYYTQPGGGGMFYRVFQREMQNVLRDFRINIEGASQALTAFTDIAGTGGMGLSTLLRGQIAPLYQLARGTGFVGMESEVTEQFATIQRLFTSPGSWEGIFNVLGNVLARKDLRRAIGTKEILASMETFSKYVMEGAGGGISPELLSRYATVFSAMAAPTVGAGTRGIYGMQTLLSMSEQLRSGRGGIMHPLVAAVLSQRGISLDVATLAAIQRQIDVGGFISQIRVGNQNINLLEETLRFLTKQFGPAQRGTSAIYLSQVFGITIDKATELLNLYDELIDAQKEVNTSQEAAVRRRIETIFAEAGKSGGERFMEALAERQGALMSSLDKIILPIVSAMGGFPQIFGGLGNLAYGMATFNPLIGIQGMGQLFRGFATSGAMGTGMMMASVLQNMVGEGAGWVIGNFAYTLLRREVNQLRLKGELELARKAGDLARIKEIQKALAEGGVGLASIWRGAVRFLKTPLQTYLPFMQGMPLIGGMSIGVLGAIVTGVITGFQALRTYLRNLGDQLEENIALYKEYRSNLASTISTMERSQQPATYQEQLVKQYIQFQEQTRRVEQQINPNKFWEYLSAIFAPKYYNKLKQTRLTAFEEMALARIEQFRKINQMGIDIGQATYDYYRKQVTERTQEILQTYKELQSTYAKVGVGYAQFSEEEKRKYRSEIEKVRWKQSVTSIFAGLAVSLPNAVNEGNAEVLNDLQQALLSGMNPEELNRLLNENGLMNLRGTYMTLNLPENVINAIKALHQAFAEKPNINEIQALDLALIVYDRLSKIREGKDLVSGLNQAAEVVRNAGNLSLNPVELNKLLGTQEEAEAGAKGRKTIPAPTPWRMVEEQEYHLIAPQMPQAVAQPGYGVVRLPAMKETPATVPIGAALTNLPIPVSDNRTFNFNINITQNIEGTNAEIPGRVAEATSSVLQDFFEKLKITTSSIEGR
jgi:hypothetical protein